MNVPDVNVISPQSTQRGFESIEKVAATGISGMFATNASSLAGHKYLGMVLDEFADDFLGHSVAVAISSV
jgi:hypothetical protein